MRSSTEAKALVASLQKALGQGDKALAGNKGYRKFLRTGGKRFAIEDKLEKEALRRQVGVDDEHGFASQ